MLYTLNYEYFISLYAHFKHTVKIAKQLDYYKNVQLDYYSQIIIARLLQLDYSQIIIARLQLDYSQIIARLQLARLQLDQIIDYSQIIARLQLDYSQIRLDYSQIIARLLQLDYSQIIIARIARLL